MESPVWSPILTLVLSPKWPPVPSPTWISVPSPVFSFSLLTKEQYIVSIFAFAYYIMRAVPFIPQTTPTSCPEHVSVFEIVYMHWLNEFSSPLQLKLLNHVNGAGRKGLKYAGVLKVSALSKPSSWQTTFAALTFQKSLHTELHLFLERKR